MNFLQLVQAVVLESGMTQSQPTTVLNQTGDVARAVHWVKHEWNELQGKRDWRFMQFEFALDTVNGTSGYDYTDTSPAAISLFRWFPKTFYIYKASVGANDNTPLLYLPYQDMKDTYLYTQNTSGRPYFFTIKPDNSLVFYPTPDAVYRVSGWYQEKPVELTANDDTPSMPERFHEMLVWGALKRYARYESAPEIYEDAKANYKSMFNGLCMDQLPDFNLDEPLV